MDYKPGLVTASIFGNKKSPSSNPVIDQLFAKKETVTKTKKENAGKKRSKKVKKKENAANHTSTNATVTVVEKTGVKRKHGDSPSKAMKKVKRDSSASFNGKSEHSSSQISKSNEFPYVHESLLKKSKSPQPTKKKEKKTVPKKKEDEEDTTDPTRRRKKRNKTADKRTIFIGNCSLSTDKKTITKMFKEYGPIESMRFRCGPAAKLELPRRAIIIKKEFHEKASSYVCYVVFKEEESAQKALEKNGYVLDGLHLRVDLASNHKKHDKKRSVFIGNLPFAVTEEQLRNHFEDCGDINNIRIVRDRQTSIGKGIAYIQFESKDGVMLAKKLNESEFEGRKLRVQTCTNKPKPEKTGDKSPGLKHKTLSSNKPNPHPEKPEQRKVTFAPSNRKSNKTFKEILQAKKEKRVNRMKKKKKQGLQKSDGLSSIFGDMAADVKKLKMDNPKFRDKNKKSKHQKIKEKEKKSGKKMVKPKRNVQK